MATGSTPLGVYKELVRMHRDDGLDFAGSNNALARNGECHRRSEMGRAFYVERTAMQFHKMLRQRQT